MEKDHISDHQLSVAIGKPLMLSPAFPLRHTERDSFPSFRAPSNHTTSL
jgi:hypothetical protein